MDASKISMCIDTTRNDGRIKSSFFYPALGPSSESFYYKNMKAFLRRVIFIVVERRSEASQVFFETTEKILCEIFFERFCKRKKFLNSFVSIYD